MLWQSESEKQTLGHEAPESGFGGGGWTPQAFAALWAAPAQSLQDAHAKVNPAPLYTAFTHAPLVSTLMHC